MKNPFKIPGIRKLSPLTPKLSLPSDKTLSTPVDQMDPETRKAHFRRLAGILGGLRRS